MAATGELIRLVNDIDDIATTLRRISASIPMMEADERKRLADAMRVVSANFSGVLSQLEKGAQ
jgi:chromosome segregation ATPase